MHFPAPVTPLTGAFLRECLEPGVAAACETLRSPLATLRHTAFGGWVFNCPVPAAAPQDMEARIAAHMPVMAAHMDDLRHRWDEEYLPRLVELTEEIDALDFSGDAPSARRRARPPVAVNIEIWRIHFLDRVPEARRGRAVLRHLHPGAGDGPTRWSHTAASGDPEQEPGDRPRTVGPRAAGARAVPAVADALLAAGTPGGALAALDRQRRGARLARALRGASWPSTASARRRWTSSAPTWDEEPVVRGREPPPLPRRRRRATPRGSASASSPRPRLAPRPARGIADPGLLAAFDHALEAARAAWPLEEDHAFYIDQRSLAGRDPARLPAPRRSPSSARAASAASTTSGSSSSTTSATASRART